MTIESIRSNMKIVDVLDYASGTADRNGATIDAARFHGICFIVKFATIAAGATTNIKAQHGDASNLSDAADIAGTAQSIAATDDNKVFVIDIKKPTKRYLRLVIDKDTTNATGESAVGLLYGADIKPVSDDADVTGEQFVAPASGTA